MQIAHDLVRNLLTNRLGTAKKSVEETNLALVVRHRARHVHPHLLGEEGYVVRKTIIFIIK